MEPRANIFIETYGCQMNVLDSELVKDQLDALGYVFVDSVLQADVVLINTCSVRELSEQKVWSQLGRLGIQKSEQKDLVIGVLGCMAEREGQSIVRRMPHVDLVCGPSNLDEMPTLIENALRNRAYGPQLALSGHTSRRSKTLEHASDSLENLDLSRAFSPTGSGTQAYVRITRGCNKFCTYCVVPYTRGPEVHRPPENIINEIRELVRKGVVEVTLLGQTVNHYEYSDGGKTTSFADLLWRVHQEIPELPRLRFITSYPRDFTDEALDVMTECRRICRYLHIPAQSGSNRILQAMNRGYTVEDYLGLLERARRRMPDIRIAGDMIVGFPSETEEDHAASVALLHKAQYKSCFIFKYSPRSGTVADRRFVDDVPNEVKKARNLDLLDIQDAITKDQYTSYVGQELDVLVEGFGKLKKAQPASDLITLPITKRQTPADTVQPWVRLRGRTEGDEIVAFDGPAELVGKLTRVRAERVTPVTILGTLAAPA